MSDQTNDKSQETTEKDGPDYRDTLFLPQTDFPMRAGLPKREPEWLARWEKMGLYKRLREQAVQENRPRFVLHDGPPYANGNLHMGHALNKTLKDIVVRSRTMMGFDAPYIPGWDCHGLPIEWKIEEKIRSEGKTKNDVDPVEFRRMCREFADHWVNIQRDEFRRLGVSGDWENPYLTMSYDAEATIVQELQKFLMNGGLYRGSKPVMWSIVEETALAEAEVEYHEHKSPTIWVRFPVVTAGNPALENASIVIWTTTPWTIPGNRAVAYSSAIDYGVYEVTATEDDVLAKVGERLVLADGLAEQVRIDAKITEWTRVGDAGDIAGTVCAHPFRGDGYDFDVPLLDGDHVTVEAGTGFVHTAPGHGVDDYDICQRVGGIEIPFTVQDNGTYFDHVPLFGGVEIMTQDAKKWPANGAVIKELINHDALLTKGSLRHSYPHSWRSKAPVIFRNTPQWFISMTQNDLRDNALKAIGEIAFTPAAGRNRIQSMVADRPDWVVSRQRAWGVPITVFVNKETGEPLRDDAVNKRIVDAVAAEGADAWYTKDAQDFLGSDYQADEYEQVTDILDVWFDSGCSHVFTLENNDGQAWPADVYLEGSDQHRGWFQSSLLEASGTRGVAPYKASVTHGFILAEDGKKMAKSGTNAVSPEKITKQSGAEIIRLWVASSVFTEDLKIGPETLKTRTDAYRKFRNTMRFILGNLHGFDEADALALEQLPALDRYMLHRLVELDKVVRDAYTAYDFARVYSTLFNFCTVELSAIYMDIRKDALYCDDAGSLRRRAAQTVLHHLFMSLTAWLAPIMVFTMEEVWLSRFDGDDSSVHLRTFPDMPDAWRDDALADKWRKVLQVRRVVTGALEIERREKRIGASLEAAPTVHVTDADLLAALDGVDLDEIAITSAATLDQADGPADAFRLDDVSGVAVVPGMADGEKCQRCWMVLPDVGTHTHEGVCGRCDEALA